MAKGMRYHAIAVLIVGHANDEKWHEQVDRIERALLNADAAGYRRGRDDSGEWSVPFSKALPQADGF